jgi:hypothetical protein
MTRKTRTRHRWLATAIACVVAVVLLWAPPAESQLMTQPSLRNLSGRVTDTSHEPIRGAIVELRDSNTNEVVTYITDASGHYSFKRLDGNIDYQVWVLFRGHPSATHNISKFDSHMTTVINFTVRTY